MLVIGIIVLIIGLIKYLSEPKYPAIEDFDRYIQDKIKYGQKEADRRWLNGEYSKKRNTNT